MNAGSERCDNVGVKADRVGFRQCALAPACVACSLTGWMGAGLWPANGLDGRGLLFALPIARLGSSRAI